MARRKSVGRDKSTPMQATSPKSTTTAGMGQAEERRKERRQDQRRQQLLVIGAVIGIFAVLATIALIVNTIPQEAPVAEDVATRYADLPQSFTDEGYVRMGNPDSPIRVKEYSSFSCPACSTFHTDVMPRILERVRAGEISFTFVPMASYGEAGGQEAAKSAMCVANQEQFWAFHDTLFEWQSLFGRQAFPPNRLRKGVENFGLDLAQYDACLGGADLATLFARAEREGEGLDGFSGTPAVTVNGVLVASTTREAIDSAIDSALAQIGVNTTDTSETPVVTDTPSTVVPTTESAIATEETVTTAEPSLIPTQEASPTP